MSGKPKQKTMETIAVEDMWIVEYSGSQDCFHMEAVETRVTDSMSDCINKRKRDWYTVGLFASAKDASSFIDHLQKKQNRNK